MLSVLLSLIYGFWLPLWYLVAIILSVLLSLIYGFWLHLRYLMAIVLSVFLSLTYGFWLHLWYPQTFLVCLFVVFYFVIILPVFLPYTEGFVWYDGSWNYNYLCNQCLSPLKLWVRIPLRRAVLDTTLCDKICQWLATGRWSSPGIPVSSTSNTDHLNVAEILL